ncbi:MAG: pyridoxamine 5'-phosphate oxidase, partial [Chloroflexi bacterium]|nr:pyridoxamine 5'-phosphate oxidase [Chloroflexota bacterium]
LRQKLQEVFRVCGDGTHSDWDEYDRIMLQQEAVVVLVTTERVYGLLR